MAFLRSVTRCNSLVSRKISAAAPTSSSQVRDCEWSLKSSRAELLSCHRYYVDLRRELNTCRHVSTSARAAAVAQAQARSPSPAPPIVQNPSRDPLDVSFNDPVAAFKSKTTWELVRAYMVYVMCSSEYLVDNNQKVSLEEKKKKNRKEKTIDLETCELFKKKIDEQNRNFLASELLWLVELVALGLCFGRAFDFGDGSMILI